MLFHKLALHIEPRITEADSFVLRQLLKGFTVLERIVEIGSFLGNGSTRTIIETIKDIGGILYCVDTWRGNQNVEWHLELAKEYSLFNTFFHYVTVFDGQDIVKPMVMQSSDAASIFRDESCDLIFIDGRPFV